MAWALCPWLGPCCWSTTGMSKFDPKKKPDARAIKKPSKKLALPFGPQRTSSAGVLGSTTNFTSKSSVFSEVQASSLTWAKKANPIVSIPSPIQLYVGLLSSSLATPKRPKCPVAQPVNMLVVPPTRYCRLRPMRNEDIIASMLPRNQIAPPSMARGSKWCASEASAWSTKSPVSQMPSAMQQEKKMPSPQSNFLAGRRSEPKKREATKHKQTPNSKLSILVIC
mmetsp:Transcript_24273/g.42483  ORF Transcript_24273/g.42483 Transcript_24273/m.42483 type:complete len:224 (+) Transcript_24273:241-912(+)